MARTSAWAVGSWSRTVRLVAAPMIAPPRTTTAPTGTSLRLTASRARSSALRMYCSSSARALAPVPSSDKRMRLSGCKGWLLACLPESQLALWITIDDDVIPLGETALQNGERQRILEQPLNRPLERARPERRIVAFGCQDLTGRRCQLERQTPLAEQLFEPVQLQVD